DDGFDLAGQESSEGPAHVHPGARHRQGFRPPRCRGRGNPGVSGGEACSPMTTIEDWLSVGAILLCLLLSFFFAGSETALTASSRAAMLHLAQDGNRNAGIVNRLLAARERLIGAL